MNKNNYENCTKVLINTIFYLWLTLDRIDNNYNHSRIFVLSVLTANVIFTTELSITSYNQNIKYQIISLHCLQTQVHLVLSIAVMEL